MENTIKEEILSKIEIIDGKKKLSCSKARLIAKKFNVKLKEIGEICNTEGIKISNCELGCFK